MQDPSCAHASFSLNDADALFRPAENSLGYSVSRWVCENSDLPIDILIFL